MARRDLKRWAGLLILFAALDAFSVHVLGEAPRNPESSAIIAGFIVILWAIREERDGAA